MKSKRGKTIQRLFKREHENRESTWTPFAGLKSIKKTLLSNDIREEKKQDNKVIENKSLLELHDDELFSRAMDGVRTHNNNYMVKENIVQPKIEVQSTKDFLLEALKIKKIRYPNYDKLLTDGKPLLIDEDSDCREGLREGTDWRTLQRLKGGTYTIDEVCDLHGLNIETAFDLTEAFLANCYFNNKRTVLLIHGRGLTSKLKEHENMQSKVIEWLTETRIGGLVNCFARAPSHLGGSGALLILIRKCIEEVND